MLDEGLAESWVNSQHRVLGRELLPFSLWHRFQLEIFQSTILTNEPVMPHDLERACMACQLTYPKIASPKINRLSLWTRMALRDYNMECQKFAVYLEDFFAPPKFLPPVKKSSAPGDVNHPPPETIRIASAIWTMTGWPEEKVWNMPIGQAYWYAAGHWYQSGIEVDFLTPEHLILQERIAAMKAAQ